MSENFNWMTSMLQGTGRLVGTPTIDGNIMSAEVKALEGRTQLVFIMEGDDYWLFASPFAKTGQINGDQALDVLNAVDMAAGVRKFGDYYSLVRFLDKGDIQADEIVKALARVALWADAVESALGHGDAL